MIVKNASSNNYEEINLLLKETTLKHIKNDSGFKNLSITFFVKEKADIFMSHGCADKNYREIENCKYLHKFKLILVPGPWLKNKLINLGIDESKISCVGWPKLDPLFEKNKIWKSNEKLKKILWVPTHNGIHHLHKSISSYPQLNEYMELLNSIKSIEIITSEHPKNRKNKKSTTDKLVNCNYVIADAGSTVYEAWALGKPVIFPDWIVKKNIIENMRGSAEEYIYSNNIGYHANNIDEFIFFFKSDLIIEKNVTEFMEEYMPSKFNGISSKVVFNEIDKHFMVSSKKMRLYRIYILIFVSIIFVSIIILKYIF